MLRAICSTWLCTASARDSFSLTVMSAPTRSRYRPRFLECETAISASGQRFGHETKSRDVRVEVRSESLVGQIEERHEALACEQLRERAPLLDRQVGARGVVAGRVQQHDVARARALQPSSIAFEEQPVRGRVVVGIALELQAATAKERRVVAPGRIAQMTTAVGATARISSAPTRSAPQPPGVCAVRVRRVASGRVGGPQHEGLDGGVVFLAAGGRHVGLGRLRREHLLLGAAHALEHRRVAARIPVDADPEIDFVAGRDRRETAP